jgi:Flp pilus assembly protein TadD/4-amino-4-deoxy-L-arabinose transferase-like glycosyltransferase
MRKLWRKIGGPGPAVIFLAALAFRVIYFLTVRNDPLMTYVDAVPDAALYHNWAVSLLGGADAGVAYYIGPAYAFFLALVYRVFGVHLYAVIFVQLVLGALTAAFIYVLGRRLFGRVPAAIAGGLWVVYLPAVYFDTQILPASLTLFLVAASLLLLARSLDAGRRWPLAALGAGALFGVAGLARPNLLLFVPALALWPILRRGRFWRVVALFAVPVILFVGAVTVRNGLVSGDWVVVSSQGGVNFFIGNNRNAPGSFAAPPGTLGRPESLNESQTRVIAERALGRELSASEASRWWFKRGLRYIVRNPGDAAKLYGRKISLLCNNYEVTLNTDFNFRGNFSFFHRVPVPYFGLLFALGTLGLVLGTGGEPPGRRALAIYVPAVAASILLFFVVDWYRLPLAPALAVAAGYGAYRLGDDWRRRRWLAATFITLAAALLLAFSWLPGVGCDRDGIMTQSYFNYGTYYMVQGDLDRAAEHYRRAVGYKEDNAFALGYLGLVYERQGRDDLARYYYLKSLEIDPGDAETNYFLGSSLARRGDYGLAIPFLKTAVETYPTYVEAWRVLAECHVARGEYVESGRAFERLLALTPGDAAARARYAGVLMEMGDYAGGVAAARDALALDPTVPRAHLILGKYYLEQGDLAAATREFEDETAVAPTSPGPFALLAECYAAAGNDAAAEAARTRAAELARGRGAPE